MGFNAEIYRRIKSEYDNKYLKAIALAEERAEELREQIPALAAIDAELKHTGLDIMQACLAGGENVASRIDAIRSKNLALQEKRRALLTANGYPDDYSDVKYECPECSDSGYVNGKMCSCMRRKLITAACESSGLGMLIHDQTFENFSLDYYATDANTYKTMKDNFSVAYDYADNFTSPGGKNLILMGGTGLGKTHISSAIAGTVISKGYDVYYTSIQSMISDFEHERFGNSSTAASGESLDRYTDCDLLILDDLGTEITNQFTLSCLFNVLNKRLNDKKSTVINTNLDGKELRSRYTDRIVSRLFGEYIVLRFVGTDVRAQKLSKR